MKKYLKYTFLLLREIKYLFIVSIIFIILSQSLLFFFPYLNKLIIDNFFVNKDFTYLVPLVSIYLFLMFLSENALPLDRFLASLQTENIALNFRQKVMKNLFNKDFVSFKKNNYGEIDTILNSNIQQIVNIILFTTETVIGNPVFIILSLTFFFSLSPYLILFILGEIISMFIATKCYAPKFARKYEEKLDAEGVYSKNLENTYNSYEDYRISFFSLKGLKKAFQAVLNYKKVNIEYEKLDLKSSIIYNFISLLFDGGALIFSIHLIKSNLMTTGDYIAFIGIKPAFVGSFNAFSQLNINFSQFKVAIDKIWEIIPFEQYAQETTEKKQFTDKIESIKLENLNFSYDKKNIIFANLNYEFKTSETYLIFGVNGSGKTSLIRLLTGLCSPDSGNVLFNNSENLKNYTEDSIINHIRVLAQHPRLLDDTIKNNLTCYESSTTFNKQFKELAEILSLDSIFDEYESIDSNIFSNGKSLSGGQVKKICLARILLGKSDLLILDEPMASLDTLTQHRLYEYLKKIAKDKIVIIITHDHSWEWNNNETKLTLSNSTFKEYKHNEDANKVLAN